ncbi:hypothetical protein QNH20_24430 [Neobacillus sp. WH10]|uniref:hypothetical protein n=1 Tax=Neobacillus sp. WH10 TaxID=3047873 RepID=UPI0024C15089|nr:hypothetical protein [Neobacillus sp. WH10]WHY77187.1 hypothetical protein QNH20_24430 [Neobacillus sp. WH10]
MFQNQQDKKLRQNKVQGLYKKIKQQNREDKNTSKIGAFIVSISVFIMFLLYVMHVLFNSGVRFAQFWGI